MNVIIVDTSSWISYFKGIPNDDIDLGLKEGRVYLSPIVVAELLSAQLASSDRVELADFLKELPLCEVHFEHWKKVGELRARLSKKGINVSTPDSQIAQCTIDLNGYLLTEDAVFKKIASATPLRLLPR
ncbi:MAG: PIN domain-containing protein [Bdellovibrionota bacterium]